MQFSAAAFVNNTMLSTLLAEQGLSLLSGNVDLLRAAAAPLVLRSLNAQRSRARRTLSTRTTIPATVYETQSVIR